MSGIATFVGGLVGLAAATALAAAPGLADSIDREDSDVAVAATTTSVPRPVSVTTTLAPPTTFLPSTELEVFVDRCATYHEVMVDAADPDALAFYEDAGSTITGLRIVCRRIGREDPAAHAEILAKLEQMDAFFASVGTTG